MTIITCAGKTQVSFRNLVMEFFSHLFLFYRWDISKILECSENFLLPSPQEPLACSDTGQNDPALSQEPKHLHVYRKQWPFWHLINKWAELSLQAPLCRWSDCSKPKGPVCMFKAVPSLSVCLKQYPVKPFAFYQYAIMWAKHNASQVLTCVLKMSHTWGFAVNLRCIWVLETVSSHRDFKGKCVRINGTLSSTFHITHLTFVPIKGVDMNSTCIYCTIIALKLMYA